MTALAGWENFYVTAGSAAGALIGLLAGSAFTPCMNAGGALFGVGAAVLLLLFIGIHYAWDAVTYHVFSQKQWHGGD